MMVSQWFAYTGSEVAAHGVIFAADAQMSYV